MYWHLVAWRSSDDSCGFLAMVFDEPLCKRRVFQNKSNSYIIRPGSGVAPGLGSFLVSYFGVSSLRYFLPIYLVAYFSAAFFWRSYVVWKQTGINPVVFKGSDDAHDYIGRVFKLLLAIVVIVALVYSFFPSAYQYLMPIPWLDRSSIRSTGVFLLILSLAWTIFAQRQMGESWRIGIDSAHKTPLVQTGVFSISRNPIFLGIMSTLFGLLFVIPNAITLLVVVLGMVLVNIQVRLEEEYLKTTHGEEYDGYSRRVRRWI